MPAPSKIYTQSRILQAFRALGIVASDVPVVLSRTGFITTAIGKSFQVYDTEKLTPVVVSTQVPKKIRALAVHNQTTFCAVGRDIYVFERIRETNILRGHAAPVTQLLAVGDYLFSIGDDHTMHIWTISDLSLVNKIEFDAEFTPSVLLHPSTYLNKVVVGSTQGGLQLWNVRTLKCIYSFKGWGSQVTSMAQSPAVDVVAIGLADGRIFIHNLKFDTTLMNFSQRSEGRVTSLSFRTDDKAPWLASGTSSGDVILWNLETQRLQAKIPLAHDADVASVLFLPSEPVLLTSSGDNSIKLWIFDQLNDAAPARLLKSRQGHKAPPTTIRYYGHDVQKDGMVCQILSASQDRSFRMFHTAREQQSAELSQGPLLKKARQNFGNVKLAPILQLAAIDTREKDWSNVVTCHAGDSAAYVWSVQRKAIGKKVLEQPNHDSNDPLMKATAVAISACGNFAFVGTLGGAIFQYNMQSGEPRGSFPTAVTPAAKLIKSLTMPGASYVEKVDTSLPDKHNGQVTGVVVDGMNCCVISTGLDGKMKFWDFTSHKLIQTIDFNSPVTHLVLHKDAGLVAAACDDFLVRLVDISTHKIVRRLRGHTHVLTDICFSPDARWIVTSSSDASLRVWDLPTGACIDWIKFPHAVTSVTMSPTGEFIATTHSSQVGIFLWANRAYFDHVFVDQPPQVPICMGMPVPLSEQDMPLDTVVVQETEIEETFVVQAKPETAFQSPISPSSSLVTLSTAPKAMWQSLFQLELIKKRNKPKEAPKAPPQAPFFLPTIRKDDVHPTFQSTVTQETKKPVEEPTPEVEMEGWGQNDDEAWGDEDDEAGAEESKTKASSSRIVKSKGLTSSRSKLATLLSEDTEDEHLGSVQNGNATVSPSSNRVLAYLQSLSASGVDVELSTLCMGDFDEEGKQSLHLFLDFLLAMVDTRQQFQLIQVYLNRFVKVHEDVLVQDTALLDKLSELHAKQQEAWRHVEQLLDHNLCLVAYLTHMQM